jgi:hypothetical protein
MQVCGFKGHVRVSVEALAAYLDRITSQDHMCLKEQGSGPEAGLSMK